MNYQPLFSVGYMLQNVICIQKITRQSKKKKRIELVLLYEMLSRMVYM